MKTLILKDVGAASLSLFCLLALSWETTPLSAQGSGESRTVVNAGSFGARAGDGSDTTPAVRAALNKCRETKATELVFPPGQYDFWPDRATEKFLFISNNDSGLKRIAFDLTGIHNLQIDGGGAQFIFHGYVLPFVLDHSRNITLKHFSTNWKRAFDSEGRILAISPTGVDVEIPEQFPYKIQQGLLVFTGENKEDQYPIDNLLEFDAMKRETAYMARDHYFIGSGLRAESIGPRRVHLDLPGISATPGNILVFSAGRRDVPAITISDSDETALSRIDIYHCGGMGVIAQRSHDVNLDHVNVMPAPRSGRVVSITADATHFADCTGRIVMTHCLFENQMDDATNIHGIYAQITRKLTSHEIEVKLVHPQQRGFDFIHAGTHLEFVHSGNMNTYREMPAQSVRRLNDEFTDVAFESPLPDELKTGDVVASVDTHPDVVIRDCTFQKNRARGLLLGSRGKIVIENNVFHTAGAALLMDGDARFWFEQGGVRDLIVRNNRFEDCNYGVWGEATIQIGDGTSPTEAIQSRYNRNITIEENLFRMFSKSLIISANSVDGLAFRQNRVEFTNDYPTQKTGDTQFNISDSINIHIEQQSR